MLTIRNLLATLLVSFSTMSLAQQPGSVMMKPDQQPMYSSSPTINKSSESSEHCSQLAKAVEALKGKPQRRHAAAMRYQQECTNKTDYK